MRKAKKASREENEVVVVTEWRGKDDAKRWLLVKRPEKGESDGQAAQVQAHRSGLKPDQDNWLTQQVCWLVCSNLPPHQSH